MRLHRGLTTHHPQISAGATIPTLQPQGGAWRDFALSQSRRREERGPWGSLHTRSSPGSPVCSSSLIFLPRDQRGTGCSWDGDRKRLCPGWGRDLTLPWGSSPASSVPPTASAPHPHPPPEGLGCSCPLEVTWGHPGQVLSSAEMFQQLLVPDRTPGGAGLSTPDPSSLTSQPWHPARIL